MEEFKVTKDGDLYKITKGKTHVQFPNPVSFYPNDRFEIITSLIKWLEEKGDE